MNNCTYIDGIASSQAIDTAGEIVDIAGLDCSSLLGAAFNWEHKSDVPAQIVGKVLDFKKIFSEKDCETDRQKHYWSKVNMPFLYVLGRLLDDKKESAREVAGLMLDDAQNPHEPQMLGFSIEGAKIHKEGMTITRSIARKVTITNMPANKTCVAEMVPASKKGGQVDLESIFKGEIEFFNPNAKYLEFLQKREQDMQKDGESLEMSELQKSAPDWTHTGSGNFSHPEHGVVSVAKQPTGEFHVKHNGTLANFGGKKAVFGSAKEAGHHAGQYMQGIKNKSVIGHSSHNRTSPNMPNMGKSMEAGSGMAAPSQLTQGAALAPESLDRKMKKSNWLQRAEQAYSKWEKREQFETFMKSKMPHLTKGEIKAIGQTLALKKSVEAEKSLSKMYESYLTKDESTKE